jgi:hypothetical protein
MAQGKRLHNLHCELFLHNEHSVYAIKAFVYISQFRRLNKNLPNYYIRSINSTFKSFRYHILKRIPNLPQMTSWVYITLNSLKNENNLNNILKLISFRTKNTLIIHNKSQ